MRQEITLTEGWNTIYSEVATDRTADEMFSTWPVEWVAVYDSSSFLNTRQYSGDGSGEGSAASGFLIWRRGHPEASSLMSIPACSVLVTFATNNWVSEFFGAPSAPRILWHQSSTNEVMNLVGFSTWGEVSPTDYFSGCGVKISDCFAMVGGNRLSPTMSPLGIFGGATVSDGQALAVSSGKIDDWSGVLNVSPVNGLIFGTNDSIRILSVRNDGATARTVSIRLNPSAARPDHTAPVIPEGLLYRDFGGTEWKPLQGTLAKRLETGETWRLDVAIDRTRLTYTSGVEHGGLVEIRDDDGGSKMRVTVPLSIVSDGGASVPTAWPKGLWVAVAELDTVTFRLTEEDGRVPDGTGDVPAGGKMKVRLPVFVDGNLNMTMLQRLWYGRDTDGLLHIYSGAVKTGDVELSDIKRISSPFLPTDQPVLAMTGEFGKSAQCAFTVGENSPVNPMRHALHPMHDGKSFDFSEASPSGDNINNYVGTVKPETFSIVNRISFEWNATSGTAWNPEEVLSGRIKWEFDGLRREGPVNALGRFTMKRISPVPVKLQ